MIFYLTYNDTPSGIFSSQVIDVVKYLNNEFKINVKLVSFISLRNFSINKQKIKQELPEAIVLPMFPGVHRWRCNMFLLKWIVFLRKPNTIIGRSVLATHLALRLKKSNRINKVIYDGRGAITAEWKEYDVITDLNMQDEIFALEKEVVLNSDYRIAVSNQLINYWKDNFDYKSNRHVVIPCTLNKIYEEVIISSENIINIRKLMKIQNDDVVFVYSGSIAGWQSFDLLNAFITPLLNSSKKFKVIFLSELDENIRKLKNKFESQVFCKKISQNDVPQYLIAADYGLLIREETTTNKVASPVKFAEYMACGLKIIISPNLGDYSKLIDNDILLGYSSTSNLLNLSKVGELEKNKIRNKGLQLFSKNNYKETYNVLIS